MQSRGLPWTPTLATCPPERTMSVQSSNVSGIPTASIATSTPTPSVSRARARARLAGELDRVRGAALDRAGRDASVAVDDDDPTRREERRGQHSGEPDRAGTDDGDRVARLHVAVEHADLEAGREDVGQEGTCSSVRGGGTLYTDVSAKGIRAYSAWTPSIRWPRIQPPPPVQRP